MLIGRIGTHEIYRTVGARKVWRCTCPAGEPPPPGTKVKKGERAPNGYPCRALTKFWTTMREELRPPSRMRFTREGADATINNCKCLQDAGVQLVREQVETAEERAERLAREAPPNEPTGRNRPCPCGSKGKYKQCCGWHLEPRDTRGERRYWPPGHEPEAEAPAPPAAPEAPPIDAVGAARRHRFAERQERIAATVRRVDAALEIAHEQTEAERMARAARTLARIAREQSFKGQKLDAAAAQHFADQAAELRAGAAELRAKVNTERKAQLAERKAQLAAEREAQRMARRARRIASASRPA